MEVERIRAFRAAEPFEPFEITLDNGRRVRVEDRFHIAISPTGQSVIVWTEQEAFERIESAKISDIKAAPQRRSGHGRN